MSNVEQTEKIIFLKGNHSMTEFTAPAVLRRYEEGLNEGKIYALLVKSSGRVTEIIIHDRMLFSAGPEEKNQEFQVCRMLETLRIKLGFRLHDDEPRVLFFESLEKAKAYFQELNITITFQKFEPFFNQFILEVKQKQ